MAVIGGGKKLAWKDYTEVDATKPGPTPGSVISAGTALGLSSGYQEAYGVPKPGKVVLKCKDVEVEITFGSCWVAKGKQSDTLLNHEQGHYRIQELGAKELDAGLAKIVVEEADLAAAQKALKKAVDDATDAIDLLIDEMQKKYDSASPKGTDHGLDASQQSRWDLKMRAATTLTDLKGSV